MKAILYQKPNDYRVTQVPIPQLQYPSTVLLKVLAADLPSYTNEVLSGKRHYDLLENSIPGVMAIGEVVSTASNVINFEIGDRVFTDPWVHLNGPDEDDGILIGRFISITITGQLRLVYNAYFIPFSLYRLDRNRYCPVKSPSIYPPQWLLC